MTHFQIRALPKERFQHLFSLSDEELAAQQAQRMTVAASPGSPCRVSMRDADVGETVILFNYCHQPADSPYRSSHAVFVRETAEDAEIAVNEVPEVIRSRLVSVRLFNRDHIMIDATVVPGETLDVEIPNAFQRADVAYAHIHNAKPGCFAASVHRVNRNGEPLE